MKPLSQVAPPADPTAAQPSADGAPPADAPASDSSAGTPFQKPDISSLVPADIKDTVDRVVAAGMKLMYSPELRDQLKAALDSQEPMEKNLAENATGLMLMLDQRAQGGIPQAAIFPAAIELMGDLAQAITEAGGQVTQDDYNGAALMAFALIGQKLGGKPDELMGAAAQSLQGDNPDPGAPQQPQAPASAGVPPAPMPTA